MTRQRLADRGNLTGIVRVLELLLGHVGCVFHDFEGPAFGPRMGVYVPWIQTSRPPLPIRLVLTGLVFAAIQPGRKLLVLVALTVTASSTNIEWCRPRTSSRGSP